MCSEPVRVHGCVLLRTADLLLRATSALLADSAAAAGSSNDCQQQCLAESLGHWQLREKAACANCCCFAKRPDAVPARIVYLFLSVQLRPANQGRVCAPPLARPPQRRPVTRSPRCQISAMASAHPNQHAPRAAGACVLVLLIAAAGRTSAEPVGFGELKVRSRGMSDTGPFH